MHGLLLESIADCVRENWGEGVWTTLVGQAGIGWGGFSIHKVYSEDIIKRIAQTLVKIVSVSEDEVMFQLGSHFMTFVAGYGYDQVTKVLGRKLCDFINGLDNLHDYISNLYKEIRPPSFYVEEEDDRGLTFHYNTPRSYSGFIQYVRGMVTTAARIYYNMADFSVIVIKEEACNGGMHGVFRVTYTNSTLGVQGSWMPALQKLREQTPLTVNSDIVFNAFPFSIIFSESMQVLTCAAGVVKSFPTLVGKKITDFFVLTKPFGIPFTWEYVSTRPVNVLVEMTSTVALSVEYEEYLRSQEIPDPDNAIPPSTRDGLPPLKLRGTIAYLDGWNAAIFMCTPVFDSLETMKDIGLYISDLSFQDSVQVLLVAGPQQSAELKIALDMEQTKNSKLEETLAELDKENKKTDALLFSMIPREIAERLKKGESTLNIAETFAEVTVLFSDVVGFTNICSRITPMEVVAILNQIYTVFDTLSERYEVYKVETIGDGYMAVSGAPKRTKLHAQQICDMALEMQAGIRHLKDPWTGSSIRIRIGIHSGGVVAGVVGQKMIRYCLFGDTVNTASRMESSGEGCEIHISKTVRDRLVVSGSYIIEDRGMIYVKGKGQMRTYWLKGRKVIKDKDTTATSETGGSEAECKTATKAIDSFETTTRAVNPTKDLKTMNIFDDTSRGLTSTDLATGQPTLLSSVLAKAKQTNAKKEEDLAEDNTMSFRKALEEIADLQTKEMVAYHDEKNGNNRECRVEEGKQSVAEENPRNGNPLKGYRANNPRGFIDNTGTTNSHTSNSHIDVNKGVNREGDTHNKGKMFQQSVGDAPPSSTLCKSLGSLPRNSRGRSGGSVPAQGPQSVAAKARSAVSILSACNFHTDVSNTPAPMHISLQTHSTRRNNLARDPVERDLLRSKKHVPKTVAGGIHLVSSTSNSPKRTKMKSREECLDRKSTPRENEVGDSAEMDHGSYHLKLPTIRSSSRKQVKASLLKGNKSGSDVNRSNFCAIC